MEKIDPYKFKEKYTRWKTRVKEELKDFSDYNFSVFMQYLSDMECGLNVATHHKKGSRGYLRLNAIRVRIAFLMREFQRKFALDRITEITEAQLHSYFLSMRNGEITKRDGQKFRSVKDYVQDFKAFWHWWQKVNKKRDVEIKDITTDLDTSCEKPDWVYLTEEQIRYMAENAKYEYRVLIWFLFDTGIRAPTELVNVRVADFYNDFKELNIRQEISKTFGRRIKLMICSELIKEYVQKKNLSREDYIFKICPPVANRYLKRLGLKLFGDKESPAGQRYSQVTLYDLRHCASCYWLPRYKSESALKYRFGWKKSDKIHYYSELLGMRDTISQEDLLTDVTKIEIEKKLESSEKEKNILQERVNNLELQMARILKLTNKLEENIVVA